MTEPPIAAARPPGGAQVPTPVPARSDRNPWHWLLLIPIVLPLFTFFYNRETPRVGAFPFFFWFQLLFPLLAVLVTTLVFLLARKRRA
jgi:hypothetical protein